MNRMFLSKIDDYRQDPYSISAWYRDIESIPHSNPSRLLSRLLHQLSKQEPLSGEGASTQRMNACQANS